MAISGKIGALFIETKDPPDTFLQEAMLPIVDFRVYQVSNPLHRYLDKESPFVVYINGIAATEGFKIAYLGASVYFESDLEADDEVTLSASSVNVVQAGGFFNWSIDLSKDLSEATTFENSGWKANQPTLTAFSASAQYYWTDAILSERIGEELIVAFYLDTTTHLHRYEGYALLANSSIELSADEVIQGSIDFEGVGKLYYRED